MPKGDHKPAVWQEAQDAFIDWLMCPPALREPLTKTEFAELHNVDRSTLYRWEKSPEFQAKLMELKAVWGVRVHGEILNRLMDIVNTGIDRDAINAAKTLLPHINPAPHLVGEKGETIMLSAERIERIKVALKDAGYTVSDEGVIDAEVVE